MTARTIGSFEAINAARLLEWIVSEAGDEVRKLIEQHGPFLFTDTDIRELYEVGAALRDLVASDHVDRIELEP